MTGTKNVDYIVGTILRTTNKTINSAINTNINNTRFFERNGTAANYTSYNFKVNQRPLFNYQPKVTESFESMFAIFPRVLRDNVFTPIATAATQVADCFAAGAKVGFMNEEPEEVEVSFTTTQGTSSIANFSLLFAKMDTSVNLNV